MIARGWRIARNAREELLTALPRRAHGARRHGTAHRASSIAPWRSAGRPGPTAQREPRVTRHQGTSTNFSEGMDLRADCRSPVLTLDTPQRWEMGRYLVTTGKPIRCTRVPRFGESQGASVHAGLGADAARRGKPLLFAPIPRIAIWPERSKSLIRLSADFETASSAPIPWRGSWRGGRS